MDSHRAFLDLKTFSLLQLSKVIQQWQSSNHTALILQKEMVGKVRHGNQKFSPNSHKGERFPGCPDHSEEPVMSTSCKALSGFYRSSPGHNPVSKPRSSQETPTGLSFKLLGCSGSSTENCGRHSCIQCNLKAANVR